MVAKGFTKQYKTTHRQSRTNSIKLVPTVEIKTKPRLKVIKVETIKKPSYKSMFCDLKEGTDFAKLMFSGREMHRCRALIEN